MLRSYRLINTCRYEEVARRLQDYEVARRLQKEEEEAQERYLRHRYETVPPVAPPDANLYLNENQNETYEVKQGCSRFFIGSFGTH